jgi:hypothetical protein
MYAMFNGLINSTQVQHGRGSSSISLGGSTCRCRMGQDIANGKMEQRLRENEEHHLQVQEYYRQREEQQDVAFAQQQVVLQVSMIVNKQLLEN